MFTPGPTDPNGATHLTIEHRGQQWEIPHASIQQTSDGFLVGMGHLLDDEGEYAIDEDGYPILHSFFLGAAPK